MKNKKSQFHHAFFAGGCFWCIVPAFRELKGVNRVISGYSGGMEENPTYKEVKEQLTGHRESICIEYDPEKISYRELLEVFMCQVDPFDGGGQFIDRGHSYTLAVYPQTQEERVETETMIREMEKEAGRRVMVSIEDFRSFWEAEEEHQDYDRKNPEAFAREWKESGRDEKSSSSAIGARKK